MHFSDIDKIIENELKMSVSEIFDKIGESFFRKYEEKITLQEIEKKNTVISLGGGAFMNSKIRQSVLLNSKSFWLDLNTKVLEKRLIKSKQRPLLNGENLTEVLKKIYNERKDTYAVANYRINCNKLSTSLIASKIINLYGNN